MPSWAMIDESAVPINEVVPAEAQLAAEREQVAWLEESLRDLELLYREDFGWQKIGVEAEYQFTQEGRKKIAELSRIMAVANPLIKRGLKIRAGYIWGGGVQVSIKDDGATGQDVNAIFQQFWDDPKNRSVLTSPEAQLELEHQLGTDGELFLALPTNPITGRVRVRNIPFEEIDKIISDPDDAENVWYYRRKWTALIEQADGTTKSEARTTYHPRLGYRPPVRPTSIKDPTADGRSLATIRWDAPIKHVAVNKFRPGARQRGIGDAFAALPWARLDKEFLENWAIYMKAMTRILWQYTTKASKVQKAAEKIATVPTAPGNPDGAGSSIVSDPNTTVSAVSKAGAQIDAESHKPLASYVAAALGVPLTILLGDPGATGARAVAETLDEPMQRDFAGRRSLWAGTLEEIGGYVIDQAVIAPANSLRGTVKVDDDADQLVVTLPEGDQRDVEIVWPEWDSTPLDMLIKSITLADQTDKMPPLVTIRLLLQALGVDDVDEELKKVTDGEGNYIPQSVRDQDALGAAADRGEL